jgi:hypothetical protein
MAENQEVIAEIKVKYEDALRRIGELKTANDDLRVTEENLRRQRKAGIITQEELNRELASSTAAIKANQSAIRVLEKEIQDNIKYDQAQAGSLNQLRASLAANTAAFAALSEAERNSVKGSMLQQSIAETTAKLKEEEEALGDHRRSVGDYEKATRSLRGQLRELTEALVQLKLEGKDGTKEYQEMADKLGQVKDAMGDVTRETGNIADDAGKLKGVTESLSAATGAFGLFTSAVGLSTEENEKLKYVMRDLQVVMTALASMTALQNALQKESAALTLMNTIRDWARKKAIDASTRSTVTATIAQKALNLVANANPYVLLATGVGLVVGALIAFSRGSKAAAEEQKKLNEQSRIYINILNEQTNIIIKNADERARQDEAFRLEWEGRLLLVREGSMEETRIRVEAARAARDRLRAMDEEAAIASHGSLQAWKNAVLESDREVLASKQALEDKTREGVQMQLDAATAVTILKTPEGLTRDNEAILEGKEPGTRSVNEVKDVPDNFKKWIADNKDRIEKAEKCGTLPYFIKDNYKDGILSDGLKYPVNTKPVKTEQ